jgi:hypothetical protein
MASCIAYIQAIFQITKYVCFENFAADNNEVLYLERTMISLSCVVLCYPTSVYVMLELSSAAYTTRDIAGRESGDPEPNNL